MQEESEDTKEVIRIHQSKKDLQHNGQKKKYKGTKTDLQNTSHKTKHRVIRTPLKIRIIQISSIFLADQHLT